MVDRELDVCCTCALCFVMERCDEGVSLFHLRFFGDRFSMKRKLEIEKAE